MVARALGVWGPDDPRATHALVARLGVVAAGANGATLDYVRRGERAIADHVDDDRSSCAGGTSSDGPGGTPYTCVGGQVDVAK